MCLADLAVQSLLGLGVGAQGRVAGQLVEAGSEPVHVHVVLTRQGRFVVGVYRRDMKAIRYLGQLDKVFGVPVTTRNWNTILAIVQILSTKVTKVKRTRSLG